MGRGVVVGATVVVGRGAAVVVTAGRVVVGAAVVVVGRGAAVVVVRGGWVVVGAVVAGAAVGGGAVVGGLVGAGAEEVGVAPKRRGAWKNESWASRWAAEKELDEESSHHWQLGQPSWTPSSWNHITAAIRSRWTPVERVFRASSIHCALRSPPPSAELTSPMISGMLG